MKRTIALLTYASTISFLLGCDYPTKHYTSMGCIPNGLNPDTGCPLSYNCKNLSNRQDGICHLHGKTYNIGEVVPSNETSPFCTIRVNCDRDHGSNSTTFIYTHIDCEEFFHHREPDCILQYQPTSCCSTNKVCGENKTQLATCTIEDQSYYEGELMQIPDQPCKRCVCSADFKLAQIDDSKYCYEDECSFEIFDIEKLYGGAAPVYKNNTCCPWTWRMPNNTDQLEIRSNGLHKYEEKCIYGALTLEIGESLKTFNEDDNVISCTCAIPPLVHCRVE
ncbi:uncharacterized protein LOC134219373 [Armigeres subalbatus]|uniref:uncharacterized protein LOC134219373 n=1 Tax=Armigeres subalbatus TaxID=124917 RepID=UPI002ED61BCB